MHVVASHLPIADWTAMSAKFDQFAAELKPQYPKLKTAMLTKASDKEAIIFVIFDDFETMQHVSSNVRLHGSRRMCARISRPLFRAPSQKSSAAPGTLPIL